MGRIQGLTETDVLQESQSIKSSEAYLFSITFAWAGATIGQYIALRNGTGPDGLARVCFAVPTASGTITREWKQGKHFPSGLYLDLKTVGTKAMVEMTYK